MSRRKLIPSLMMLLSCNEPGEEPNALEQRSLSETADQKIERHFTLMDQAGTEREWQESIKVLKNTPDSVSRLLALHQARSTQPNDDPRRERLKAVHTLGYLGRAEAIPHLARIAEEALPDPAAGGEVFEAEYRVRLGAVAALERLRAGKELRRLYDKGGLLRNATAASLYEIGEKVPGSRLLDPKVVMGPGDPTDHNPKANPRAIRTKPALATP